MSKPIVIKVLTAGEGGVGKTTLLRRYVEGTFIAETKMTIGVEFFLKELEVDGKKVVLQLWDFGGQERFRFLLQSYALGARGALILFDLTRPATLDNIEQWVNICRSHDDELPMLFIGTKLDIVENLLIDDEFASRFVENYSLFDYLKISSKTGENVDLVFEKLAKEIVNKLNL